MPNSSTIAIVPGQQAGASWGTGAAYMIVAEAYGAAMKKIDVWRLYCAISVTSQISIALVICEDKNNIGSRVGFHDIFSVEIG